MIWFQLVLLLAFGLQDDKAQEKKEKAEQADKQKASVTAEKTRAPGKGKTDAERKGKTDAEKDEGKSKDNPLSGAVGGLRLRSIGPGLMSGRIVGLAVHPQNRSRYFVAVASGGVWKTENAGVTFTPVFDNEGSYSIGYIAMDPANPNVLWVGTGENNSQRSVSYGDGVYRSDDNGRSWTNVGLKKSEHIGKILIDPRDSNVVFVAAQGPLWGPGGDRGLYKTTDRGKSWKRVLNISENTGVTDVVCDPRNPDVMIAASYQRRRHVWTLINGGPESALYRSTDGGENWTKLRSGLPGEELGRIGLAVAPSSPNVVYAIIESVDNKGGIFRSDDFGVTWEKRNDFDQQGQYYSHLVVDPKNENRIYVMNVLIQLSDDGGRTLSPLGERWKHVDNHCMWIDPNDVNYYLVGCDGGLYESHDRGQNWRHFGNLPITQFYDASVDNNAPFYHVYGGTQDNNTLGGPARTKSSHGIMNQDWFVTLGGDGFQSKVDPTDPNIVYCELQYGVLTRYDRKTGESVGIQPQPGKGEPPLRWNWDSPLVLSPHSHTRLYFAANILFRSDDRGDSWRAISPDLTRQLNRDDLPVMGKIWGPDAVSKHVSTSFYGNCVALTESPKKEGLIYVGTDDGLIQITEDGGQNWRKVEVVPGVPERTYVARLFASQHDENVVYACFDNHKNADFAPYLARSTDKGKTWTSIVGDLPKNGPVLAIAEDHVNPKLIFVGTEFGLFATTNGGEKWLRLKSGLPTIAVRDLVIQKQMDDLVVATFGRGFYILDDYSPLRTMSDAALAKECELFPIRPAYLYLPTQQYGGGEKASLGASFYTAENPEYGAVFTYHLKEGIKTRKARRKEAEKKAEKEQGRAPYPTKEELRAEAEEEEPTMLLTIRDAAGSPIRIITGPVSKGLHRVTWDLRGSGATTPSGGEGGGRRGGGRRGRGSSGSLVAPGDYQVEIAKRVEGVVTPLVAPMKFTVIEHRERERTADDRTALAQFLLQATELQKTFTGIDETATMLAARLDAIKRSLDATPKIDNKWRDVARSLEAQTRELLRKLEGDSILAARNENVPTSIRDRVFTILSANGRSLESPTKTARDAYRIAVEELAEVREKLNTILDKDLKELEKAMDEAGAPHTPGRLPVIRK